MSDVSQSAPRTSHGRFTKGNPGGPGRPRKVVKAAADALDQRAAKAGPELFDMAFGQARGGSLAAVKFLLDRVWPVACGRGLEIAVPEINGLPDLVPAGAALTNAVFAGEANAQQGAAAARVLQAHMQAIDLIDLERRITELEESAEDRKPRQYQA